MINVLQRLDGVRETGPGQYMARCSAHNDRSPSLAVRVDDDRILLHCFAGCDVEDVVFSLGLTFADLMPDVDTAGRYGKRTRRSGIRALSPRDGLIAMDKCALVVACIASDVLERKKIDEDTWELLAKAVERIGAARDACCPARHKK